MGTMNFGLYPMIPRYKGKFKHDWEEPYLEGSRKGMFKNTFADIEYILTTCAENNTRFEIECYDIGHLYTLQHFLDRGVVKPPLFVQSVFGILGGIGAHPEDVIMMKRTADRLLGPENYRWSVLGAGGNQMRVAAMAASMGGNVRVGMEDSLWIGAGKLAESNAQQVTNVRKILEGLGLEIANPDEAREILVAQGRRQGKLLVVIIRACGHLSAGPEPAATFPIALTRANPSNTGGDSRMASLDTVSIAILLGSLLVLAGILSSLIALRFGAPLLLVFLLVGMLAGEGGPGGVKFNDVGTAYTVGSIALALILFDGGLRTRFATFRNVLAPSVTLATFGVVVTALLTAPVAKFVLGIGWTQALLVGAVVASTDAAAVFFLINARGLRLRPRVRATLEVESGTNDPFAVFLALLLVELLSAGKPGLGARHGGTCCARRCSAASSAYGGGRIITLVLNRVALAQGLHAPFVAVSALVIFAFANAAHALRLPRRLSRRPRRRQPPHPRA